MTYVPTRDEARMQRMEARQAVLEKMQERQLAKFEKELAVIDHRIQSRKVNVRMRNVRAHKKLFDFTRLGRSY